MSGSALRWAALNLFCAGQPGTRRRLLREAAPPAGGGAGAEGAGAARIHAGGAPRIPAAAAALLDARWEDAAARELERARRLGVRVLTLEDDDYPPLLRAASDPPLVLYVRGDLAPGDALAVAVVGSRRATPHGLHLAESIARGLGAAGFTVVSGLARGIDAAGHRGALTGGGRTIAVLGSGIDRIYPAEHRRLAEMVARRGALLSELPLGAVPLPRHFPERNRIIAGLSWSTVVVEAARDSGSLITAALAAEDGRAVHAVPGPVGAPGAEGPNALLRDGALVCRSAGDILEDLAPQIVEAAHRQAPSPPAPPPMDDVGQRGPVGDAGAAPAVAADPAGAPDAGLTAAQRRVLAALSAVRGIGVEDLGRRCGIPPGTLLATLMELELLGLVRQIPGPRFLSAPCKI
jgi:DNA processing protein